MTHSFCQAPDTGLHVYTNGDVKVCCAGTYPLGSIRNQSIIEIFSSDVYQKFKESPTKYCQGCIDFAEIDPNSGLRNMFHAYPSPGHEQLKVIDIRWNNVCNLSCRYCNPTDSSEWAKLLSIPIESANRDYIESIFQHIIANKDSIECVMLLGGEPLMQKHNERLLSIINPDTKIDIVTNLSANLATNKIYQLLKNFKNITWLVSMDNVGERLEYVRHNTSWDTIVKNIDTVIADFGLLHVGLMPIYHIWSALNLRELYAFANSKNVRLHWQLGLDSQGSEFGSDTFLVSGHNSLIIDKAIAEIDDLGVNTEFQELVNYDAGFLNGVKQMLSSNEVDPSRGAAFLGWTDKMEQLMPPKKTFSELWPELNTLLRTEPLP